MAKVKKSTKKFKKKGLGEHTSRRKVIKRKDTKPSSTASNAGTSSSPQRSSVKSLLQSKSRFKAGPNAGGHAAKEVKAIPDMELDEFLDGGFEAAGAEATGSEDDSSDMDGDLALEAGDGQVLEPNHEMPGASAVGPEGV